jgi:replicative DNA helicase
MASTLQDKLPPQNIEAEQSALGACLIDQEATATVSEVLPDPDDFYRLAHRTIYSSILSLFQQGEPVDIITVSNDLASRGKLEEAGGPPYLTTLINVVPTSANVEHYANIIKEKAILRRLIYAGTAIASMGYLEDEPIHDLVDKSERLIYDISEHRLTQDFIPLSKILHSTYQKIEELYTHKVHVTGVPSGFREFDNLTAGFQKGNFIVIAARPSMGKTALVLNIAQHVAANENMPVGLFSLEMSKDEIAQRFLSAAAQINAMKLRTGHIAPGDWGKINRALNLLNEAPIFVDDSAGITVMEIRSKARRLKAREGLRLIIVDYLQLIVGKSRVENRNQELSEISRQLKNLAKELEIPVIALSQLSRDCERRTDKHPLLSDLRESGAIEQDADMVVFIYRDKYYNPQSEKGNAAEIMIAKQRNGPIATVEMGFMSDYARFVPLDTVHEEPLDTDWSEEE